MVQNRSQAHASSAVLLLFLAALAILFLTQPTSPEGAREPGVVVETAAEHVVLTPAEGTSIVVLAEHRGDSVRGISGVVMWDFAEQMVCDMIRGDSVEEVRTDKPELPIYGCCCAKNEGPFLWGELWNAGMSVVKICYHDCLIVSIARHYS